MQQSALQECSFGQTLSRTEIRRLIAGSQDKHRSTVRIRLSNDGAYRCSDKSNNQLFLTWAYKELCGRKCEVLQMAADGKTNKEISEELRISQSTVEQHITEIGNALRCSGEVRKWLFNRSRGCTPQ